MARKFAPQMTATRSTQASQFAVADEADLDPASPRLQDKQKYSYIIGLGSLHGQSGTWSC